MKLVIAYISILSTFLAACISNGNNGQNVKQAEAIVSADEVQLTEEQVKNAGIVVGAPQDKIMYSTLKVNGVIDVPPQNIVSISFPYGGYLKSSDLLPGMKVKKGEILALLEDPQYIQLQQDYLMAKSRLEFLQSDYNRQNDLNEGKAASDKVFQQAKSEFESQKVLVKSLSEKLYLINIDPAGLNQSNISRSVKIKSPITGFVSKVYGNIGRYINPTDVLFDLVDPTDIHLSLTVFEKDIRSLALGQEITCYSNNNPDEVNKAKVFLISKSINENRAIEVHCHFEQYDPSLLPGMFMNAEIHTDDSKVKAVPAEAVVKFENKNFLFISKGNNKFKMIPIEAGLEYDGFVEVKSDLLADQIVLKNAYSLLMKIKSSSDEG